MEVVAATSFDERFDPQNVINSNLGQFWITTGLYPQEVVIDLKSTQTVSEVRTVTTNVKKIIVEGCSNPNANDFKKIGESNDIAQKGGSQHNESIRMSEKMESRFIKIIIADGHDHFATVHKIEFI